MTLLYAIAWILGTILTLSTLHIVLQSELSRAGKAIISLVVLASVVGLVLPEKNPLLVFAGLALLHLGVRPLKLKEPPVALSLLAVVASIVAVFALNTCLSDDGPGYSGDIVKDVRANVSRRWKKIVAECDGVSGEYKRNVKPGAEPKAPTKGERRRLDRVRELLLPVDCRDLLAAIDDLDRQIARTNEEIVKAEGERLGHPDESEKYDERIIAVRGKKAKLEEERAARSAKVLEKLQSIGLSIPGSTAERCLFPVNVETLIDNAVVAKDIALVVENLGRFYDPNDLETAKRYFGMYLVMIDVQIEGFRLYLEKSENGEWRNGINAILRDAEAAVQSDMANASQTRFSPEDREKFRRNAETKKKTIEAAMAYLDLLKKHEDVIRGKLHEAEEVREVAWSNWKTVTLASDLKGIVRTSQESFQALLSLELPPLALFDDSTLQAEFDNITRELRKE